MSQIIQQEKTIYSESELESEWLILQWLNLLDLVAPATATASTSSPNISRYFRTSIILVIPGHCNNFFEVGAECEDDPIFVLCTTERKEKGEFWLNSTWRSTLSFTGILLLHFVVVRVQNRDGGSIEHTTCLRSFSMRGISAIIWL
nr:hypothetical protein CFP56_30582 [Quercus suber]